VPLTYNVTLPNVANNSHRATVDGITLVRGSDTAKQLTQNQIDRLLYAGLTLDVEGVITFPTNAPTPSLPHKMHYSLEDDFGAPESGSVQAELQNAVDEIVLNQKGGSILLNDREYDFDAIVWPTVGLNEPTVVIEFVGPFAPSTVGFMPGTGLTLAQGGDMPPPMNGAILKSSMASGSAFGNIVANSNILPIFRNLVLRCPSNPQWHGIDAGWLRYLKLENVVIDTGRSWGDGSNPLSDGPIQQPTNAGVVGAIFPGEGNGGVCIAEDLLIAGFYKGLRHSEHFDGDRITIGKCVIGYQPTDGWHAARIGRLSLYWNKYGIQPDNMNAGKPVTPVEIQQLDTEEDPIGTNWYSTTYHINDPSNVLRGRANFRRMVPAAGPTIALRRYGGAYFNLSPSSTPPKAVYDVVGFGGADSAVALPASLIGQAATQHRGAWGVTSKRAYIATRSNTTNGDFAVWETGQTQVALHTRVTVPTNVLTMNMGLAVCAVDNANVIAVIMGPGTISIQKIDAGVYTNVTGNLSIAMVAGQEFDLRVTIIGKTLRVYLDGGLVRTYTLTAAEAAKYFASTAHGLFAYTQGVAGEQGGANGGRWGFLRIESAGPLVA
jgi:hypothetical protein